MILHETPSDSAPADTDPSGPRQRVLWLSTAAFTLLFNVWMMLGVLSVPIRRELGLSDTQLEWMIAAAILSGALFRLNVGMLADTYGGRLVMSITLAGSAVAAYAFSRATTYPWLLAGAIFYGLAGNSFAAGVAWNSAWLHWRGRARPSSTRKSPGRRST